MVKQCDPNWFYEPSNIAHTMNQHMSHLRYGAPLAALPMYLLLFAGSTLRVSAQNSPGDYLYYVARQSTNNLWTINVRDPVTGLPQVMNIQTVSTMYGGCNGNHGAVCNAGTYRDRAGFLWVVDWRYFVVKMVPPPMPAVNRVLFTVDFLNGPLGDVGTPFSLVFDTNGDALVTTHYENIAGGWHVDYLIRINGENGGASVELVSRANGHGLTDAVVLADERGRRVYYLDNFVLHRLRLLGPQWVNEILAPFSTFQRLREAPGNRLLAGFSNFLYVLDPDTGTILSSYAGPNQGYGTNIFAVPGRLATEVWCIGVPAYVLPSYLHRVILQPDGTLTDGMDLNSPLPSGTSAIGLSLDCYGRLFVPGADGNLYYSDTRRTRIDGFLAGAGHELYYFHAGSMDPNGIRRASTVDKFLDEDHDGYSNLDEIRAGSHPFDSSITPIAAPPSLYCTPTVVQGQTFTLALSGRGGSSFLLAMGDQMPSPIPYPGLVGLLRLLPGTINVLLGPSPTFPIALPLTGTFALTLGVPNNPILSGLDFHFQALTWSSVPSTSGFSNLGNLHIL